ncbi:MAG: HlyD family secretion protein [Hyphomonadaceae bacterium]
MRPAQRLPAAIGAFIVVIGAGLGSCVLLGSPPDPPAGFAKANGRLEARQIDIIARYPGRVIEIQVQEGDAVAAGDVIARLDTRELEAALRAAEARIQRARQQRAVSDATIAQQNSALRLATLEYGRAETLHHRGFAPEQFLDQRRASQQTAAAGLRAAQSARSAADADTAAAQAEADRIREQIREATLVAPRPGRVLYRLAESGELINAGGPIATLLDTSDIYMTVFLPTREAGALAMGAPARIVLDARADAPLPARVSFISPEAQFTPRQVETRGERDNLMYRVRVRITDELTQSRPDRLNVGVTGVAYIQLRPDARWPARLQSERTRRFPDTPRS